MSKRVDSFRRSLWSVILRLVRQTLNDSQVLSPCGVFVSLLCSEPQGVHRVGAPHYQGNVSIFYCKGLNPCLYMELVVKMVPLTFSWWVRHSTLWTSRGAPFIIEGTNSFERNFRRFVHQVVNQTPIWLGIILVFGFCLLTLLESRRVHRW